MNTGKLLISYHLSGKWATDFYTEEMTEDWFNLKINQVETSGSFKFSIFINDERIYSVINTTPKVFTNVQAEFGRNRDHSTFRLAEGSYRNLQFTSKQNTFLGNLIFKLENKMNLLLRPVPRFTKAYLLFYSHRTTYSQNPI